MDWRPGDAINDRYRLVDVLGQGGMGRVWLARDLVLGRDVAVKELVLPRGVAEGGLEALRARALREARAAGGLKHPGIITVHDVIDDGGDPLIVMELIS